MRVLALIVVRWLFAVTCTCLAVAPGRAAEVTTAAAPEVDQSDALPITLKVDNPIVVVRHEVTFSGKGVPMIANRVSLDIEAPRATPPQAITLEGTVRQDGEYTFRYTPTVSGTYTALVTGTDKKGTSIASTSRYCRQSWVRARLARARRASGISFEMALWELASSSLTARDRGDFDCILLDAPTELCEQARLQYGQRSTHAG